MKKKRSSSKFLPRSQYSEFRRSFIYCLFILICTVQFNRLSRCILKYLVESVRGINLLSRKTGITVVWRRVKFTCRDFLGFRRIFYFWILWKIAVAVANMAVALLLVRPGIWSDERSARSTINSRWLEIPLIRKKLSSSGRYMLSASQ